MEVTRWGLAGLVLVTVGLLLSVAPMYGPTGPGGEPTFLGTYWVVGLPVLVAGVAILSWDVGRHTGRDRGA